MHSIDVATGGTKGAGIPFVKIEILYRAVNYFNKAHRVVKEAVHS